MVSVYVRHGWYWLADGCPEKEKGAGAFGVPLLGRTSTEVGISVIEVAGSRGLVQLLRQLARQSGYSVPDPISCLDL